MIAGCLSEVCKSRMHIPHCLSDPLCRYRFMLSGVHVSSKAYYLCLFAVGRRAWKLLPTLAVKVHMRVKSTAYLSAHVYFLTHD